MLQVGDKQLPVVQRHSDDGANGVITKVILFCVFNRSELSLGVQTNFYAIAATAAGDYPLPRVWHTPTRHLNPIVH